MFYAYINKLCTSGFQNPEFKNDLMKNILLIIIASLNLVFSYSQEKKIKGVIIDNSNTPIMYANIGVLNKPLGTVSNEKGKFSLNIYKNYIQDTLKVSCLGYKSKELLIKDLLNDKSNGIKISLDNYTEKLKEIIITSRKLKTYTKGKKRINSKNKVYFAIPSIKDLNLGSEIGRKFSLGKKKPSILENFKFYLVENNFKHLKFRLNIYSIKNKRPEKKLNGSNILVNVDNSFKGWVNVNLIKYGLKVKQDIIITIEWINTLL